MNAIEPDEFYRVQEEITNTIQELSIEMRTYSPESKDFKDLAYGIWACNELIEYLLDHVYVPIDECIFQFYLIMLAYNDRFNKDFKHLKKKPYPLFQIAAETVYFFIKEDAIYEAVYF